MVWCAGVLYSTCKEQGLLARAGPAAHALRDRCLWNGAPQQYNLRKKTEHAFKSLVMDSRAISVASPAAYAQRFCGAAQELFVARADA